MDFSKYDTDRLVAEFDKVHADIKANDEREVVKFKNYEKPARKIHPILYLLVEVKGRELRGRAKIAAEARKYGISTILGPTWLLYHWLPNLPPGIVLTKTMGHFDRNMMIMAIKAGHLVAGMDEEVFGIKGHTPYLEAFTDPKAAGLADIICAQGPDYVNAFPFPVTPTVTGSPRELSYKKSSGNDILVCTYTGCINAANISFSDAVARILKVGPSLKSSAGEHRAQITRGAIIQESTYIERTYQSVLALADAFPDRKIVLRTHPAENGSVWKFSQPNISIDKSASIYDALESSGVIVYVSSCTTGLDAFMAGVPAVRIGQGGHGISSEMHTMAESPQDVVTAVKAAKLWDGDMSNHVSSFSLCEHLTALCRSHAAGGQEASIRSNLTVEPEEFHLRKFPDTTPDEIEELVGSPVKQLAWNTFLIQ